MKPRTRAYRGPARRVTDREVGVVVAVLEVGSEKAAAHRLGLADPRDRLDRYGVGEDGLGEAVSMVPDETRVDMKGTTVMTRDLYVVLCNTHPAEGQRPYPAVLLKVLDRG